MKLFTPKEVNYRGGFTLIELLVVVAIIGILATLVIGALGNARERARDARRQSDIKTIQNALEMYYLDNGHYPAMSLYDGEGGGVAPSNNWINSGNASWQALEAEMGVDLPEDPINEEPSSAADHPGGTSKSFNYVYGSSTEPGSSNFGECPGQGYILIYRLESGDVPLSESPGFVRCAPGNPIRQYGNGGITLGVSPRG